MFLEVAENPHADWGTLLSNYTRSFKQLESLLEDIDPLFHLNEVIPTKITEEHPSLIPYLLSTQVEKQPDVLQTNFPSDTPHEEESISDLLRSVASYNDDLDDLLSNLPNKRRKYE